MIFAFADEKEEIFRVGGIGKAVFYVCVNRSLLLMKKRIIENAANGVLRQEESKFWFSRFTVFICNDGVSELVGAGSVVPAFDAFERCLDFFECFSLDEAGYALQISAATADKFHVVDLILFIDVEDDLTGASTFCIVSEHSCITSVRGERRQTVQSTRFS